VEQWLADAAPAHDFMPQVASDPLGAIAPEQDPLLHVDHTNSGAAGFRECCNKCRNHEAETLASSCRFVVTYEWFVGRNSQDFKSEGTIKLSKAR